MNGLSTYLTGYGRAHGGLTRVFRPTQLAQVQEILDAARTEQRQVALRGAGRSYGDAAFISGGWTLDLQRMNRILEWNPETGVITVEPGVTIAQLWQHILEDGWWIPVVPGTAATTLGGCLAMNVHGKNNFRMGTIGEHVLEFEALLPDGRTLVCSPTQNADWFYAMIGGLGILGIFTRITLQMKRIYSGLLRVSAWAAGNLHENLQAIESNRERDYIVGWLDATAGGRGLGRGQLHAADYLHEGEDSQPQRTLHLEYQHLPDTFFSFVPASILWRFMAPFMNNPGAWLVNTAKYAASRLNNHHTFLQPHAAFHFLLDYVPNWINAYGRGGLIQYQSFIPKDTAEAAYREILRLSQRRGLPAYLGVLKRHRPDPFLLTHAVDGYSLALDFRVTARNRIRLQALTQDLNRIVLEAGGRFYFAKDSTLSRFTAARFLGEDTLKRLHTLKQQADPENLLQTDLYRRLLG